MNTMYKNSNKSILPNIQICLFTLINSQTPLWKYYKNFSSISRCQFSLTSFFHNSTEFCTWSCAILAVYNKLLLYKCKSYMYCIFLEVVLSVQLKFCQLCYYNYYIAHSKRLCELQGFFICNISCKIFYMYIYYGLVCTCLLWLSTFDHFPHWVSLRMQKLQSLHQLQ